ncbi:MAG: pitrilysin family protein [Candidatus Omnitrophota bacterium]
MNTIYPVSILHNKLKVVTHSMKGRESVALGIWFAVGGRYETKKISGISHFIEHLVFKGTPTRNVRTIKAEIEGRGGLLNAFTNEDTTCFLVKIVKKHLPLALEILADMCQNPLFKAIDIERERGVILEEIKMYMDMPMQYAHDLINQLLWPDQPLGMFIAGDFKSVTGIGRSDIIAYHNKYYRPSNTLATVCGDISHEETYRLVHKYFPRKREAKRFRCKKVVGHQSKPRFNFYYKKTEQSHLVIGMHALKRTDPQRYALALLHVILGANMSSRLYEEVREKRGLAYSIRSGLSFYEDTGSFTVSAGVENKKIEATLTVIMKELAKIKKNGVKAGELMRGKEYFLNQLFFALDDTLDRMLWIGDKAMHFDQIPSKDQIIKRIEAVTVDAVQSMAAKLFKNANLNLVVIGPLEEKMQKKIRNQFTL